MASAETYSKGDCPYCKSARTLLRRYDIDFIEHEITGDLTKTEEMARRAGGRRTVPQIFLNGLQIGGADDLAALECSGGLPALLARLAA